MVLRKFFLIFFHLSLFARIGPSVQGPNEAMSAEKGSVVLDDDLVTRISAGHKRLEEYSARISGTITQWRGNLEPAVVNPFATEGLNQQVRARFFVSGDASRLEYINPQPGTVIQPGDEENEITEVLVHTPDSAFRYVAVSTTGTPYATLFKYADPACLEVDWRLKTDLRYQLSALTHVGGTRILDLLQRPSVRLARKSWEDIDNALLVSGSDVTEDSQKTGFEVVLDAKRDYMARRCVIKTRTAGITMSITQDTRISEVAPLVFVPSELATLVATNSNGVLDSSKSYRELVQIDVRSLETPKAEMFSEEGFASLHRDYTVVDVGSDDTMTVGNTAQAAPQSTRFARGSVPDSEKRERNRSLGLFLLLNGFVLVLIGVIFLCRRVIRNRR